jgi:hypothetical protein
VELTRENIEQIEEIVSSMDCPKDFKCYKCQFEDICKATYRGLEAYADCCDFGKTTCEFRVPFGNGVFCRCPLRVYVAKHLKK